MEDNSEQFDSSGAASALQMMVGYYAEFAYLFVRRGKLEKLIPGGRKVKL